MRFYRATIDGQSLELQGDSWRNALERSGYVIKSFIYSNPYYVGLLESGQRFRVMGMKKTNWNHPESVIQIRPLRPSELTEMSLKKSRHPKPKRNTNFEY